MRKAFTLTAVLMAVFLIMTMTGCGRSDEGSGTGTGSGAETDSSTGSAEESGSGAENESSEADEADSGAGKDEAGAQDESGSEDPQGQQEFVLSFETSDLEGNTVRSGDLFAASKLTMLNIWGTFCGPCINEMPQLEALSQEYAEKDVAVVGMVIDVPESDDTLLPDAKAIVKDTGVTYTNLRIWDGYEKVMALAAVPTTLFLDSSGHLVGTPVIGADLSAYRTVIDDYLGGTSDE